MTQQIQFTKAVGNANEINELLRRYGVKFGIYKNGVFNEFRAWKRDLFSV